MWRWHLLTLSLKPYLPLRIARRDPQASPRREPSMHHSAFRAKVRDPTVLQLQIPPGSNSSGPTPNEQEEAGLTRTSRPRTHPAPTYSIGAHPLKAFSKLELRDIGTGVSSILHTHAKGPIHSTDCEEHSPQVSRGKTSRYLRAPSKPAGPLPIRTVGSSAPQ
ncbi:hypothetical protein L226DRAFT_176478 [Lentinus tigrinus ALCF2SS1-7]|uniref:Uncharacterized protein n=1 Tax=Lentinus tigrinus ALCF2SS1-6 TaxID=1328759 RepID=A0A5C2RZG2_9APHY|nr:hypothetical protein L227DRAFT_257429 [Lentinus tigrinus ALCF2SS1-6]RPD71494.1 hypothetical protein L226DRAFT_176478 [Lentinus tigrinus ALCF2SS1-7]